MITSIPAALPAIAIASSGSPPRNPPTLASIDECVPVSVNVTTLACGNPAGWPLAFAGPPNAARLAGVSSISRSSAGSARPPCENFFYIDLQGGAERAGAG
jgi:hypothetical protein